MKPMHIPKLRFYLFNTSYSELFTCEKTDFRPYYNGGFIEPVLQVCVRRSVLQQGHQEHITPPLHLLSAHTLQSVCKHS